MTMTTNPTSGERVLAWADQLARCSDTPDYLCRTYLSPEHRAANDQVAEWMRQLAMTTREDAAGNLWGRVEGRQTGPALVMGSHLDTVRDAGRYDGMLGVLVPLMALLELHLEGEKPAQPVEIVGFADEEGTRFGTTLLGSRAVTGRWDQAWNAIRDAEGVSLAEALLAFGLDPARLHEAARDPADLAAYIELHIEQGPVLEDENLPLGVVTSINGARRLRLTVTGQAGHAGTVPMTLRRDALMGAVEVMAAMEQLARDAGVVATFGQIDVQPGAVNVIPGQAVFSLDIRSESDARRDQVLEKWLEQAAAVMENRGLQMTHEHVHQADAVPCDVGLQDRLAQLLVQAGEPDFRLPSGAGHDAMAMAEIVPVGMLFLRCAGGISHNPAESVTAEDVTRAVAVTKALLRDGL